MRLTMAPYCAAIRPAACVPAMPSACTVCSGVEPQAARGAGRRGEHADRRARVPALPDVLLAHAHADARPDLVAGDRGGEEFAPAQLGVAFGDREQRRQGDRADVQHARAMHVVELEALHLRAVDERRVRRREPLACPRPLRRGLIDRRQRILQDAAPFQVRAEQPQPSESRISSLMRSLTSAGICS